MQILETINRGGFGRVERVMLENGQLGARKVFDPIVADDDKEKLRKRFEREARTQSALVFPAIMPIIGGDLTADPPWYLMPLAECSLADRLAAVRAHQEQIPAVALADMLNGLEQLHALGYVHRDLKPQNVLLYQGTWRLTDFGLVLPLGGSTTQLTTKSAWGTTSYAAPEQAVDFHHVTAQADIYSFGCILHDFYGTTDRIPYHMHSADGPLGVVIEKCTETEPARRFQSVAQLRQELLPLLDGSSIPPSAAAEGYISLINNPWLWTREAIADFAAFLRRQPDSFDVHQTLRDLDEASLQAMHETHPDKWREIVGYYCEWVGRTGHGYSFCDLLAKRLDLIVEIGDIAEKAKALLAAAAMAAAHNRWYVMQIVLDRCGPTMDDNLAHRVAVEIRIGQLHRNFEHCARTLGMPVSVFHARIMLVIADAAIGTP